MKPTQSVATVATLAPDYLPVTRCNDSFSPSGRRWFFRSIVFVSLAIASLWALNGAWYVLPFSVLELVVLYVALKLVERHSGDFESIQRSGDRILVEQRRHGRFSRHEFNRYWVQLVVTDAARGQLAMRSHGHEVTFGEFLSNDQRFVVTSELRRFIKSF